MKDVKDNFSGQADLYAKYRPDYPQALYEFLYSLVPGNAVAWDCGTGNGQVAIVLSEHFKKVYATDISEQQVKNARIKENIIYSVQRSESTAFPGDLFDLVTVAQAIHWFDFEMFYKEMVRAIKPQGIFAIMGYGLLNVDAEVDKIIARFYHDIVGPYWDKERKYIDEHYQTIPFPFTEIESPRLTNKFEWSLDDLLGYFKTWSAVQHYKKANNQDPVELVKKELEKVWFANTRKPIEFPVLLRVARIEK